MQIDSVRERQAVQVVMDALEAGRGGWVITPHLDILRQYVASPQLRPLFDESDLVVADGMPLVWASRVQGTPLPERVAGSSMIWSLSAAAAERGGSIYLLGGEPGAAEESARKLRDANPGLRLAGVNCPPHGFERDAAARERVAVALRNARPDIVYVALGFPKQEMLIRSLRGEMPSVWFLGVGISLSFVAGRVRRAPTWMRKAGLEWLHRLIQEPRRLSRRYLIDGLPFAVRLFVHALRSRLRPASR